MASPIRDGTNHATVAHTGGLTGTIPVTCSAGAIVVLAILSDQVTTALAYTNSMAADTSGLVWVHVGSVGQANAGGTSNTFSLLDVWVGKAIGALVAATVTVTASTTIDDWAIAYSSYTGQAASPLDPNAGLPVVLAHNTPGALPELTGINTSNPDDMLVFVWGSSFNSSAAIGTLTPAGATSVTSGGTNGGSHFAFINVVDLSVNAAQVGVTMGGNSSLQGWQAAAFALTADAAVSGGHGGLLLLGVG